MAYDLGSRFVTRLQYPLTGLRATGDMVYPRVSRATDAS